MDIRELYTQVNAKLRNAGKPKLDIVRWIEEISIYELQRKVSKDEHGKYATEA